MTERKLKRWSQAELETLETIAREKLFQKVPELLPGRTVACARAQAYRHGFLIPTRKCQKWKSSELEFLLENQHLSNERLSETLDRSPRAIELMRYQIGARVHYPFEIDLSSETWAYLAGFFDGDGWVGLELCKSKGGWLLKPSFAVSNTNIDVIEFFREKLGVLSEAKTVRNARETRYSKNHRDTWQFCLRGRFRVAAALKGMLPYLIVKRASAEFVLDFINSHEFGPATKEELERLLEFRLKHHQHGDKRCKQFTNKLRKILESF